MFSPAPSRHGPGSISILVAFRMLDVPLPGAGDDVADLGVGCLPAQLGLCAVRAGHQAGGIALAAGHDLDRNLLARRLAAGLDDLQDRIPLPCAEIVGAALVPLHR